MYRLIYKVHTDLTSIYYIYKTLNINKNCVRLKLNSTSHDTN